MSRFSLAVATSAKIRVQTNARMLFSFFFSVSKRFSLRLDALHTVAQLCTSANLVNSARHTCSNRLFFRVFMTPALTPVRPGLYRQMVGLPLSVIVIVIVMIQEMAARGHDGTRRVDGLPVVQRHHVEDEGKIHFTQSRTWRRTTRLFEELKHGSSCFGLVEENQPKPTASKKGEQLQAGHLFGDDLPRLEKTASIKEREKAQRLSSLT